jgi:hypothetical protein
MLGKGGASCEVCGRNGAGEISAPEHFLRDREQGFELRERVS